MVSERRRSPRGAFAAVLAIAVVAAVTHVAAVYAYPRFAMHTAWERLSAAADADGLVHAPRPDAALRTVVRPSPDLVYSVCVYDLARGPWSIRLAVPDTYLSVSLYAMNTDNYFTVNDRQIAGRELELSIVSGAPGEVAGDGEPLVVRSPGTRGIALIRYFAGDGEQAEAIEAGRQTLRCGPAHAAEMAPSPRERRLYGE